MSALVKRKNGNLMRSVQRIVCHLAILYITMMAFPATANDPEDPDSYNLLPDLVSLTVTPSEAVMLVGEKLQLSLIATYSDGSMRDVTTSDDTFYDPGNDVVEIEETGRIIALSSGTELISARYGWKLNLALVWVDVTVVDPLDTDGDGVPNDVELAPWP
ncbi:MAG: hypothetical protein HC838_16445 [Spirulinaceae cyanobacterium RM2_2_10]|nr:hypothetical protein [Spirulinaceae cyanobacterium RM2_2_10]